MTPSREFRDFQFRESGIGESLNVWCAVLARASVFSQYSLACNLALVLLLEHISNLIKTP